MVKTTQEAPFSIEAQTWGKLRRSADTLAREQGHVLEAWGPSGHAHQVAWCRYCRQGAIISLTAPQFDGEAVIHRCPTEPRH